MDALLGVAAARFNIEIRFDSADQSFQGF